MTTTDTQDLLAALAEIRDAIGLLAESVKENLDQIQSDLGAMRALLDERLPSARM